MGESSSSSSSSSLEVDLPGFRFHPTEEELLNFYLRSMVSGNKLHGDIIAFLNIYKYQPTELPGLARMNGEREWYFFVPRDRKHGGGGGRPNRTTEHGFWKATGSDRKVLSLSDSKGRAPRRRKTDWVMNEFRLPDHHHACPLPQDIVLRKIYRKATPLKVLEQRAAMEETHEIINTYISPAPAPSMADCLSFCDFEDIKLTGQGWSRSCTTTTLPTFSFEWNQDTLWTLDNLTSTFMPTC